MDKKERIIETLAATFHENWRDGRLMDDWRYRPMMEKSKDDEWNMEHWTDVVDIANTKFEDLPSNWKHENLEAAKVVVDLLYEKLLNWKEITSRMVEEMSELIHDKRLERNWKEWSFENQRVVYEELPEEEKSKDRVQVELAIKILKGNI